MPSPVLLLGLFIGAATGLLNGILVTKRQASPSSRHSRP